MSNTKENSKRCKQCGFRVRGKNHEQGSHHQTQNRVEGRQGKKKRA